MNQLLQGLRNLGPVRLGALALVAALMLGFFAYIGSRVTAPTYSLLYGDLDLKDSAQIVQKLEASAIPFQLRGDGAQILVPSDQVARLRMVVAEAGLPRGGSIGYEIFDKSEALGTTSFVQNVNNLRALEGELSRTIGALSGVVAARVHLVLPKREMFSRERQDPSASIVVRLRGAERLGKGQVAAIQHLVAGAVPGLKPGRISIVDQEGNLLARGGDEDVGPAGSTAEEMRVGYETRLARTVEEMLERSVGIGKVRVEVRADMDFDRVTTNTETFDPESQVVRSTQSVSESSDNAESGDQSVTVANNLPDAQKPQGQSSSGGKSKSNRNEETVNYEITKTVKSHIREGGVVNRLSVAVLVDGVYAAAQDGARNYQPRSPEELQQLGALVRSAIGYNQQRGDTVEVVNLRFVATDEPVVAASSLPLGLSKGDVMRIAETLVLSMVALLVFLFVVRPFLGRLTASVEAPALAGAAPGTPLLTDQSGGAPGVPALTGPEGTSLVPVDDGDEAMININQVEGRVKASSMKKINEIVDKHPEETIAILRSWMYEKE